MSKRSYTRADKIHALKVVELCDGNVSAASRETGIPRPTIILWMSEAKKEPSDYLTTDSDLTIRQKRFADELSRSGKATDAARKAGYAVPDVAAVRLLGNDRIRARIAARLEAAESLSQGEVKGTLTQQMRADLDDFVNKAGYFSLDACRANGVTGLVKRLDYDEFGSVKKFEVYNAQQAARDLARILGMTQPKTQPINQINVVYVNDWRGERAEHLSAESASWPAGSDESSAPI